MQSLVLIVHVALAIGVIGLVLIQHGKGADAGAAFGSGASGTVFGSRGSASFLTRMTTALAALFFVTSLALFYIAAHRDRGLGSVTDSVTIDAPAAPADEASDIPVPDAADMPSAGEAASGDNDMPEPAQ